MLITGLNGTLAKRVNLEALRRGFSVDGWDRNLAPPENADACRARLAQLKPCAIIHLAMGSEAWAAQLAAYAFQNAIPFVFTSSAMVFDNVPDGPHRVTDERTARDDYGRYKMRCEDAILAANPQAMVVRIGWQIDLEVKGNNMLCTLDDWQERQGCVAASRLWKPACSFMEDTAQALLNLIEEPTGGLLHLDSNAQEGHSFDSIVAALRETGGRKHWQIRIHDDYAHDQRLVGGPARLPALSERLVGLCSDNNARHRTDTQVASCQHALPCLKPSPPLNRDGKSAPLQH